MPGSQPPQTTTARWVLGGIVLLLLLGCVHLTVDPPALSSLVSGELPWSNLSPAWSAIPAGIALALMLWWTRRRWNGLVMGLAAVLLAQVLLAAVPLVLGQPDDAAWREAQQERALARLETAVQQVVSERVDLDAFVSNLFYDLDADSLARWDPFVLCATWREQWRRAHPHTRPVAVVLWREGQRVGWAGDVITAGSEPRFGSSNLLRDERSWALRALADLPGEAAVTAECQLWLADAARPDPSDGAGMALLREVVRDARPPGRRTWGDAQRGLRVVEDVVLAAPDARGVRPRLRLSVQVPARGVLADQRRSLVLLIHVLLAGLSLVVWGRWRGAGAMWFMAWLVRGWWAWVDAARWFGGALAPGRLPADPGSPASLLDPAYFATGLGGGWFGSGVDALLSALLIAGTAAWLWRSQVPPLDQPVRRWWRSALVLVPLVLAGLSLSWLWTDLAANANARLLGLQVPLGAWTFWVLHFVILAVSVSVGMSLVLLWLRLAGGWPRLVRGAARPYLMAAGLLALVLFNYAVLSRAYGQAERDWLRRKADSIVQAQDEWIGFLVEDVLSDLASQDAGRTDPSLTAPGQGSLHRGRLAHHLWRRSAIRDLGLPGLVEVLAQNGETESLYATGFLRDFSYEVLERSDWWPLGGVDVVGPEQEGVLLQEEVRRYPTGLERVLRGEIARRDGGWLRLELSIQSLRISTLSDRLLGLREGADDGGYQPRQEVDRPVLLLRGDQERWLDVGFGEQPERRDDGDVVVLKSGGREWAEIDVDGHRWLCRWAPLPPELASRPGEGFLLGLQRPTVVDRLLDVARLLLLNVLLLGLVLGLSAVVRRRWRWVPGFQGRFLAGYLLIGVVLLVVAGVLADRQTFERIDRDARTRTRDGLVTALGQLQGLLTEQARALASSDYIADLMSGRLAGERRLGPFAVRQGMVFGPDGALILDETLSDLDDVAAAALLQATREAPLVVMHQPSGVYLGVSIPIDLSGVLEQPEATGTFVYRQQVDDALLPGLAEVIGGEVLLRLDGEVIDASHPGRVLDHPRRLLASPAIMRWYRDLPGQPRLQPRTSGITFSGGIALPALSPGADGGLVVRELPAILLVEFPDRERDFSDERREMALFLAGLITLLLLTAFGLAMALTWNIFEPLRVLLAATRRLAAGDYRAPLPPAGSDEVGRLADGFQSMRDQLQNAREVLESRERFLRAVLERVPVGVLVWDRVGRLAAWNPAAADILRRQYPEPAVTDDAEADVIVRIPRLRDDLARHLGDTAGELPSSDGRRTMRVGQAPVELGDEAPHQLVVCEDLTEFLSAKKQALNAELARQVAHEIKNPLTPIQLSAQLVQQAQADQHPRRDEIVDDAVRRILEQVTLLRTIAGEFSLLGRPGELECTPVDLAALVRDVVAGYTSGLDGEGPRITVEAAEVPQVSAHRDSLLKVLGNLIQNSMDAAGGPDRLELTVTWRRELDTVASVWTDNGPGIPEDVAGRLFDPYFSTKSKGTGLGLAICRNLLEKMGGAITLRTADGGTGAVATVTLPRADAGPGDGRS